MLGPSFLQEAVEAKHWRELCPELHVDDASSGDKARESFPFLEGDEALADRGDELRNSLLEDGYFWMPDGELPWGVDVDAMGRAVGALVAAGLPPSCILMYDEPWIMAAQLRQLIFLTTGGNEFMMDWSAFHVRAGSAGKSQSFTEPSGWQPHRDRGTDDAAVEGFRTDGTSRSTTFWLALTDATPESSCLTVVPRQHDPGYSSGDKKGSPLTAIFKTPEAFQHIRALPVKAGGLIAFTHRLLHWGSAADPRALSPRIAIAFGTSDPAFEAPFFSRANLPLPSIGLRLALVAGQCFTYCANERVITTIEIAKQFWDLFRSHAEHFNPTYRAIVTSHKAFLDHSLQPTVERCLNARDDIVEESTSEA